MEYKPDWPEAERRLTALWHHERLDRPCIAVVAPADGPAPLPVPAPADDEARWLDPGYRVAVALHDISGTWWGGEAVPSSLLMANWVVCLGGTPRFSPDTIWFDTRSVDFGGPSPFRHDPDSPWMRKFRSLLLAMCKAAGRSDFLVGQVGGLGATDLLAMCMGAQEFLFALIDHSEWMREAIIAGARDQHAARTELQALVRERHDYWYGSAGWMPIWGPEPFTVAQSDVSCMLSPEMFDRFVLPELDIYGGEHGALWYHLDGRDARQHLPRLLSLPYLRFVQYTPAPAEQPNGPAHMDMYRAIQAAGRVVHIELPWQNVEPLVRALDPSLLMLQTSCPRREDGERLLEQSVAWAAHA